jgi:integrase
MRILRALWNYARARYRQPDGALMLAENPVKVLSEMRAWNRVAPKARRVPNDRIGAVWNLLQALRVDPGQTAAAIVGADILVFLLCTGARWSEAAGLTWDRVNTVDGWWHLPDPKNRNPVTFPLSRIVVEMLATRPQTSGFVFPHRTREAGVCDARGTLARVSEVAGTPVSAHDLRRTFRAVAAAAGVELWRTKLLMNHAMNDDVTIHSYTERADLRYLRAEIEAIAGWIERQGALAAAGNVVDLGARRHA